MEREAHARAVKHNEQVYKRIGWKTLIVNLLEKGWFNQPDKTPISSVMAANFEDVVRAISTENAML